MTEQKGNKSINNRQMRIDYKNGKGEMKLATIDLPCYDHALNQSYREMVDRAIDDIMEDGGCWINESTIIPAHMITAFHTVNDTNKKKAPHRRRTNRKVKNGNSVTDKD